MAIRIDGTNTTANPGITGADADTGLQLGTDELKLVTGGTEAITVDSSQNVGIGTGTPGAKLVVVGDSTANDIAVHVQGGDGATTTTLLLDGDGDAGDVLIRARANVTADPDNTETAMLLSGQGKLGVGAYQNTADLVTPLSVKHDNNYSIASGNTSAGIFIESRNATAGNGQYGSGICFSKINSGRPGGAISSIQTNTDVDRMGLAFHTHSSTSSNNVLVESFRISHNGTLLGLDTTIAPFSSDERVKENIRDLDYNLNTFKSFRPRIFDWKNPEAHNDKSDEFGFIAQEVQTTDSRWALENALPANHLDAEYVDADRIVKTVKLGEKDAMYVSVIQQLLSKIETLETQNADLLARVTALENA